MERRPGRRQRPCNLAAADSQKAIVRENREKTRLSTIRGKMCARFCPNPHLHER